ncbi:DinB family protein [Mycoplasmatota bacterium]|nr:DinB family protein [Mycoplasmatota bacterium]
MVEKCKNQFNLVFSMLEKLIEESSEKIWNQKIGGHIYFQQLLHTLMGINFWFRDNNDQFIEPFKERGFYPEFEEDPLSVMSKTELINYKNTVKGIINQFFFNRSDQWLNEKSLVYSKLSNLDIIFMQVRHVQYHIGYCNALLHENEENKISWIDYYG